MEDVALDAGHLVVVGRDGVEMPGHDDAPVTAEVRAGNDVQPDPFDVEAVDAPEPFLDGVGEWFLREADRWHGDESSREAEKVVGRSGDGGRDEFSGHPPSSLSPFRGRIVPSERHNSSRERRKRCRTLTSPGRGRGGSR